MTVGVFVENRKLDLYKDDSIEIVSSVADTSDVSKIRTDFSKSFTVPASDNNNNIFKHYYDADIDNGFDARIKVNGRIEIDGLPFRNGKITLQKVNKKKDKAESYTIGFFGNLVSLKDKVKDDELTSLDFSDLNFTLTSTNVINKLKSTDPTEELICTLLSKRRFYYNSNPSDQTQTDTVINIANKGFKWSDLRPSIKLIEIIKAIETKYDILFSRDFLGREEFDRIYLWLNNTVEIQGRPTEQLINWTSKSVDVGIPDLGLNLTTNTWSNVTYNFTNGEFTYFRYRILIETTSSEPYSIIVRNNGQVVATIKNDAGGDYIGDLLTIRTNQIGIEEQFNYQFFVSSTSSMTYTAQLNMKVAIKNPPPFSNIETYVNYGYATSNTITSIFQPSANLPKMKIIDFLKSLFQMFKLVAIQNNDTDIYLNTQNDWYSQGRLIDLTKYVDYENIDVERGKIFNEIDFKFEDPTTILNSEFKQLTRLGYGEEELKLADENGELLDGEKLEVKPMFEQIIYERLSDVLDGENTNIMYGLSTDRELKPVNPKAVIFYRNIVNVTDKPFKMINDSNAQVTILGDINTSSHTLNFDNVQFSTIFSEEFSTWDGSLISNNLYTNYWKDYILSVFNIKRRSFKYDSILPLNILLALKLNDVIKIKDDYFRIDTFTTNIVDRKCQLNLINSFDNTINPFDVNETIIFSDAKSGIRTVYVLGNSDFTATLSDTSFASVTINGRLVLIDVDVNRTGVERSTILTIITEGKTITIPIFESAETVRTDNNIITADSTLITADNG